MRREYLVLIIQPSTTFPQISRRFILPYS